MKRLDVKNVVTVFEVKNIEESVDWYQQWLGEPDVIPMDGVVEYKIAENVWLQLSCEGKDVINSSELIIGVEDIRDVQKHFSETSIALSEIQDFEFVWVVTIEDLDGNKISFAQEVD